MYSSSQLLRIITFVLTPSHLFKMPPKTSGKAAAKSATRAITKGDKKKRKGKRKESYAIKVLY